jgi:putative ABC transport system ATP-binding protein/lipoprotein-releasing system ATP-binding protein
LNSAPLVVAENLVQYFTIGGKRIDVLRGVDLSIAAGEKLFLCGASGAGKTTLLYTLAGLERPVRGSVLVDGRSIYDCRGATLTRLRNERMGYVFQNYLLLPELTALENVLLPAMIGGRAGRALAIETLDQVGLADRIHHLPAELSGGEQQRVAIARALINKPDIIFADEPTGNLDSQTGGEVMSLLLGIASDEKKTLIVVTHDTELAREGDRTLQLADGRIL